LRDEDENVRKKMRCFKTRRCHYLFTQLLGNDFSHDLSSGRNITYPTAEENAYSICSCLAVNFSESLQNYL